MKPELRIAKNAPLVKVTVGLEEGASITVLIVNQVNIKDLLVCLLVTRVALVKVNPLTDKQLVSNALWVNLHQELDLMSGKKIFY